MATLAGFLRALRGTTRVVDEVLRSSRFVDEVVRSYPPEWAAVVEEYRAHGVELDGLQLRGIVQYLGLSKPKRRHLFRPDDRGPWPLRTVDLVDRLRADPSNTQAAEELARRGYRVTDAGEAVAVSEGRGAPPKLWRTVAQELAVSLRGPYGKVTSWDQEAKVPGDLVRHVHQLLVPYFPDVTEARVRNAIEDLER